MDNFFENGYRIVQNGATSFFLTSTKDIKRCKLLDAIIVEFDVDDTNATIDEIVKALKNELDYHINQIVSNDKSYFADCSEEITMHIKGTYLTQLKKVRKLLDEWK